MPQRGLAAVRLVCWLGAAALVGLAVALPAVPARAGAPSYYSGTAVAAGEHYVFDSDPPLTVVADLVDTYAPEGSSDLDSSGDATAFASTFDAQGAGDVPALLCLAASGDCPAGFPPANPLDASASYPATPSDTGLATYVGQPLDVAGLVGFTPGDAEASAAPSSVTDTASLTQADTAAGVPGLITSMLPSSVPLPRVTAASVAASTHEYLNGAGDLVDQATSTVSGLSIAGTVTATSLQATATATFTGAARPDYTVHTTLAGLEVDGHPATLSDAGITLLSTSDKGVVGGVVNGLGATVTQLTQRAGAALSKAGITGGLTGIHFVGDTAGPDGQGGYQVEAGGLDVEFSAHVSGLPSLSLPQPPAAVCTATDPIFSSLPVGPCELPGVDPNATYFGTVTLGAAGVDGTAGASPASSPPASGGTAPTGPPPTATTTATGGQPPAGTTTGVPGTVTAPLSAPPAATTPAVTAPTVAPAPAARSAGSVSSGLAGAGRVSALMLALLLGSLPVLLTRLRHSPARLPAGAA